MKIPPAAIRGDAAHKAADKLENREWHAGTVFTTKRPAVLRCLKKLVLYDV